MTLTAQRPAGSDPMGALRNHPALASRAGVARWVERTGSTNADLRKAAKAGELEGPAVLAAGEQTDGRGRQGRAWRDVPRGSVLCSVAWPFAPHQPLGPLSLAVGVWLAEALHGLGATGVRLKWPNDLLLDTADTAQPWSKLGGILVEVTDTPRARWAVIGFGINLRQPPSRDLPAGGLPAGALDDAGIVLPLEAALPALAGAVLDGLAEFAASGDLAPALGRWPALHAWNGLPVAAVEQGRNVLTGIAVGLAPDGALLLDTPEGLRPVHSADLSLRLRPDPAGRNL